ncbi:Nramp family divalent metal transporter [Yersinia massiliensis]|jgi:manganese transport protein|uniref:Divalent metal cation transporter MntH n=2 Tax=Yersinia TaxID=629 RepID=A0A2R4NMH9_9GAMM|nr:MULTISPECIES: Nramp family divalent metal transporter [Yersinia]HEC1652384.1 Nramp family divalent metal transporter [Yersinia enterocolitica]ATM86797.1 divalent metal cation transporter [Yersinia frederiksenii]AVX37334.1 divalent metal cation transporter [Yersinia massiliensis]MCB5318161.1 Nramp family divalent metal transporter [Yersinia massiliensis]MDA5546208.1 Nramp family divalent metal transporter [Yersinia massiliensis]
MLNSRAVDTSPRTSRRIKLSLMGPAFIAAIAYIDPGNFATNIQAGASFGYTLLWVVVWANVMAMLVQLLSAKLGIATGKNLAEHIRDRFPRPVVWAYWVQAEIIVMATDLAEFIGAAIGFKLLLGVTLLEGAVLTGIATFLILMLQNRGQKPIELVVGGLLMFVAAAYIVELIFSQPNMAALGRGMIIPNLPNSNAVFLAAGVLGATIMPHVIYLHSALTQTEGKESKVQRYASTRFDVAIAMTIAGFVNLAMMATAAAAFHFNGYEHIAEIEEAYLTLQPLLGNAAATVFGLSLVAAGLSSTVVGTMAGQVVMQGFVRFYIPMWLRRSVTMLPSFIVILMGIDATKILVMSQVLLSFGIALALVPLLIFTRNKALMGELVDTKLTQILGKIVVAIVIGLNAYLLISLL